MPHESNPAARIAPPRRPSTPAGGGPPRLWRRLPTVLKVALLLALAMLLLGAEVELCLAPQLDVVLTLVGIGGMWAWFSGWPPAE